MRLKKVNERSFPQRYRICRSKTASCLQAGWFLLFLGVKCHWKSWFETIRSRYTQRHQNGRWGCRGRTIQKLRQTSRPHVHKFRTFWCKLKKVNPFLWDPPRIVTEMGFPKKSVSHTEPRFGWDHKFELLSFVRLHSLNISVRAHGLSKFYFINNLSIPRRFVLVPRTHQGF